MAPCVHHFHSTSHKLNLRWLVKKTLLYMAGMLLVLTTIHTIASKTLPTAAVQQESKPKSKTFSGTILKSGDQFVLSDAASKINYVLDDAEKASPFEGKKVKVTGTVDVANNTIHVELIQEVT
jgi:hypothetical protein